MWPPFDLSASWAGGWRTLTDMALQVLRPAAVHLFGRVLFSQDEMLNQGHSTANEGCLEHSALSLGRVGGFSLQGGGW